jgi:hypothetical protein
VVAWGTSGSSGCGSCTRRRTCSARRTSSGFGLRRIARRRRLAVGTVVAVKRRRAPPPAHPRLPIHAQRERRAHQLSYLLLERVALSETTAVMFCPHRRPEVGSTVHAMPSLPPARAAAARHDTGDGTGHKQAPHQHTAPYWDWLPRSSQWPLDLILPQHTAMFTYLILLQHTVSYCSIVWRADKCTGLQRSMENHSKALQQQLKNVCRAW